jgi:hypothetical protein
MSGPTKRKGPRRTEGNRGQRLEKRIAANLARVNRRLRVNCVLLVAVALASFVAEVLP